MQIRLLSSVVIVLIAQWVQAQYVFAVNDFQATRQDLNLCGQSEFYQSYLRLTSARPNQQGACWFKTNKIMLSQGFETEFTFLISESGGVAEGGDGFAFILQNRSPNEIGGIGDKIGYQDIPYVLSIEFDTKNDNEGSRNQVNLSFYSPTTKSYRRYATVHEIPEITDGQAHFTKIIYNGGKLEVFLDSYIFPILSVKINVAEKILSQDGYAWVGFSSATSDGYANHDLLQWSLKQFEAPPSNIHPELVEVIDAHAIQVTSRKLTIKVWDHNIVDGDIISLKWGDQWILSEYPIITEPREIELTVLGFSEKLVLYAHNVGQVPPNTATVSVSDGTQYYKFELNADLETSEALVIQYVGTDN
ncbi:MAG TPA: L-type lectin-domain containing protein [Saprospiraceae bacterium]|nr:L-type lectin-domain containing protein [Saprospiraceae bacterium]